MPAITRSQTARFVEGLRYLGELCYQYNPVAGEWDLQMPIILAVAHRIGLRVDHDDHSHKGQLGIEFHQWVQKQNPLAGARHLYPADVLNYVAFVEFADYDPYTFETFDRI